MFFKHLIPICFLVIISNSINSQTKENLESINSTWEKFYKAFETLDYKLMADIHTKDLVRVSGGRRILDYDTYINNYKAGFERDKKAEQTSHIVLRFFERISNDSVASERGIYKLIR